jgi:lipopolysaccharide export system protein LptA
MRPILWILCLGTALGLASYAGAADKTPAAVAPVSSALASSTSASRSPPARTEITADQSLEWYQDQHLYVARGNAKAVRGALTVEADTLTAHEREPPPPPAGQTTGAPANAKPVKVKQPKPSGTNGGSDDNGTGDIDRMTAEGNVRVTTQRGHAYGDHAIYDLNQHVAYLTGQHLLYETPDETVTARDTLEYWEDRKVAVARGNAIAIKGDKHVEGDVLTAQFRDQPNGKSAMQTLTADGHVTVITKGDVSKGDRAVYDVARNIAVITGHVHITRADGTELNGDVGEMDFATNQSRLLNEGAHTRVRVLLSAKASSKGPGDTAKPAPTTPATPAKATAIPAPASTQGSP